MTKRNGKIGRGDLVLMNVNIGGHRHLIIDVALNHEFGNNHMADVTRNGALRAADPAKLLEATARTKIGRYREARQPQWCHLCLPDLRHADLWEDAWRREGAAIAFKFRLGQYFWHTRTAIGHGAASPCGRSAGADRRAHLASPPPTCGTRCSSRPPYRQASGFL